MTSVIPNRHLEAPERLPTGFFPKDYVNRRKKSVSISPSKKLSDSFPPPRKSLQEKLDEAAASRTATKLNQPFGKWPPSKNNVFSVIQKFKTLLLKP